MEKFFKVKGREYKEIEGLGGQIGVLHVKNIGCCSAYLKKGKKEYLIPKSGGELKITMITPSKLYAKSRGAILTKIRK